MSRAGNVYADLAISFARSFPVGELVSVKDFDLWGMDQQEISSLGEDYDGCSKSSAQWQRLLMERNDLRRRINEGASSTAFVEESGYPSYSVGVNRHGDDYLVKSGLDSYESMAQRLPEQVEKFAKNKRSRIVALKESIDFASLPIGAQLSVEGLDDSASRLVREISRALQDFNEDYAKVQARIRKLDLNPRNGALIGFIGKNDPRPPMSEVDKPDIIERLFRSGIEPELAIEKASDEERIELVEWIIEQMSEARVDSQGGYPDQWDIHGDLVIIASLDHDGAPDLTVSTVRDFLTDKSFYYEDWVQARVSEEWG